MNNQIPLLPQGSLVEQKNKNRARVKVAVFFVLAIHAVGLLALLMQGCRRDQPAAETEATNSIPQPTFENTNPVVAPSNSTADVQPTPPPPVVENTPPPVTPTATASDYAVLKGDNYWTIGKKFGVTAKQLTDANPGVDPAKLKIGQKLHIPAPSATAVAPAAATPSGSASGEMYTVKSGDNLITIAKRFNTTVKTIRADNNLKTDSIKVGQKLKISAKPAVTPLPDTTTPAPTAPGVPK
jgi:LysM repeat protein